MPGLSALPASSLPASPLAVDISDPVTLRAQQGNADENTLDVSAAIANIQETQAHKKLALDSTNSAINAQDSTGNAQDSTGNVQDSTGNVQVLTGNAQSSFQGDSSHTTVVDADQNTAVPLAMDKKASEEPEIGTRNNAAALLGHQGENPTAGGGSLAQGENPTAGGGSLAQGENPTAGGGSVAQGENPTTVAPTSSVDKGRRHRCYFIHMAKATKKKLIF